MGPGVRNELEPFWASKCGAPERAWSVLSVKMRVSGTARARLAGALGRLLTRGGVDERVEITEILKNYGLRTAIRKKCKIGDAPERIFLEICENEIRSETEIQGWKWVVSRAAHTHMHTLCKYPPPRNKHEANWVWGPQRSLSLSACRNLIWVCFIRPDKRRLEKKFMP